MLLWSSMVLIHVWCNQGLSLWSTIITLGCATVIKVHGDEPIAAVAVVIVNVAMLIFAGYLIVFLGSALIPFYMKKLEDVIPVEVVLLSQP